jgi:hypothetical protein
MYILYFILNNILNNFFSCYIANLISVIEGNFIPFVCQCQHSSIDDTSVGPSASLQSAMPPDHHQQPQQQPMKSPNTIQQQQQPAAEERMSPAPICGSSGTPEWIRAVRQRANHRLKEWAAANIKMEHRMAVHNRKWCQRKRTFSPSHLDCSQSQTASAATDVFGKRAIGYL